MEELKTLFGEGSLSYDEFEQKLGEAGDTIKLANLKSGNYVDKAKYDKLEKSITDYQTKFDALKESTSDYDKLKTDYDDISTKYNDLLNKQDVADKMNLIKSANVNPKFEKFIYSEVLSQVNDSKDFQSALNDYLKDNKEFLNTSKGTYVNLQNGVGEALTPNEKMNSYLRSKITRK